MGLCALAWSVPPQLRYVQDTEEHLQYSSPLKCVLHKTMSDCLFLKMAAVFKIVGKRLKAEEEDARVARADPVVGEEGAMGRDSPIEKSSSEP